MLFALHDGGLLLRYDIQLCAHFFTENPAKQPRIPTFIMAL
jgi:hypothetical protein